MIKMRGGTDLHGEIIPHALHARRIRDTIPPVMERI